jgi:hypothetical protein
MDGLDQIYNDSGEPILQDNEVIRERFSGMCINWATRKKGKLHGIMNFEGEGEFIVTDRRLLFLRKPKEFPAGYWATGRQKGGLVGDEIVGGGDWQYALARSNRTKRMGGLEFFEVSLEEIVRINIANGNAQVYIENGDKFKLLVDNETGEKLARLLKEI